MEREQEREEFLKDIQKLHETLQEKETHEGREQRLIAQVCMAI